MADPTLVELVQLAYPRLWQTCHVEHRTRGRPHGSGLTDRESGILAHLEPDGVDAGQLAEHLGIAKSTLSAHIARLEALGLLISAVDPADHRRRRLSLTASGRAARQQDAVLDPDRVAALLDAIPCEERERAVHGLVTLAAAAARMHTPAREATP